MWTFLCFAVLSALIGPSHQNSRPTFVQDVVQDLQGEGILENTPNGTVVGQILCKDDDPGDVIFYKSVDTKFLDVDNRTGVVFVSGKLDSEDLAGTRSDPVKVKFACIDYDKNGNQKSDGSEIAVDINVIDVNDERPKFSTSAKQGFSFNVSEGAAPGTVLNGIITITDNDLGDNAVVQRVEFSCDPNESQKPCQLFGLNLTQVAEGQYTVTIVLKGTPDYETDPVFNTQIIAVDGAETIKRHNTGSTGVRILVQDRQDTNPRFENPIFNFAVKEGLPVNTTVNFALSARDMDRGSLRDIYLEILDNPKGLNFFRAGKSVEGDKGIFSAPVIVRSEIDREIVKGAYTFTAKATELFDNGSLTTATVTAMFSVRIEDINDNAPKFLRNVYEVSIPEVEQNVLLPSITVPDLQVNDPDKFDNAKYKVDVLNQSHPGAFGVTPDTEVSGRQVFYLTVNNYRFVDYDQESYRNQVIVLRARETETQERLSSIATVRVTVTDINDHKPEFVQSRYEEFVSENTNRSTTILTLSATDKDTGMDGQVFYSISDTFDGIFRVDRDTGDIILERKLDYEGQRRTYGFLAYAIDKGAIPKTTDVQVVIHVTDYNEDGPQFISPKYTGQVSETSLVFLDPVRVEAIDPSDTSANITYRIVSGNTPTNSFVLNPISGELSLRERVSFEQTPNQTGIFTLVVEASDNSNPPLTQTTTVVVKVIDENNNKPIFDPVVYRKTISEGIAHGTSLLQVSATDADHGSNGQITYRIGRGGRDSFVVTEDGRVYISASSNLDYDQYKNLTVYIIATDGGSPQYSATATMLITITDTNNKPPSFVNKSYNAIIDEALSKGSPILRVSATDPDTVHRLQYSLRTDTISALNKAGADYRDGPYILKDVFEIGSNTGQISLSPSGPGLDRTYMAEVTFQVQVQDILGVDQFGIAYVFIVITGRPETELFFTRPWTKGKPEYKLDLPESTALGKEIKTLHAQDPVDASRVTYYEEVPNTDDGDYFRISDSTSGKVVLNRRLDYESGNRFHSVVVRAVKGPTNNLGARTVTATINLEVLDSNDNAPYFTKQDYVFTVKEGVPINYRVGEVTAYDDDTAKYGPIEFYMGVGQDRNDFILYQLGFSNTAEIRVNRKLNVARRNVYNIDVIAKDNANRAESGFSLETKAKVKIIIEDENDHSPTFTDQERSFSVPETAPVDTRLGQVLARDDDFGRNGEISYSLQLPDQYTNIVNPLDLFGITEVSGVLVTKQLLRGLSRKYKVMVVARDKGSPPRQSSIPVTIKVQGVEDDDGTPKWTSPDRFVAYVAEHSRTKLDINLNAVPRTPTGHIIYSLVPLVNMDHLNFRINSSNGDIFVIADLDREVQDTYTLLVEAKDSSDATKVSRRQLLVYVTDIDDNVPSFMKSKYAACPTDFQVPTEFTTVDDTPQGTIVAQAVACDPDGPANSQMYYYRYLGNKLCQDSYDSALQVNLNGTVESTKILDYEQKKDYLVCVEVRATMRPQNRKKREYDVRNMTDTDKVAYLVIKIVDRNDNGPRFPEDSVVGVLETTPGEDTVLQVLATDPDGPLNNRPIYAIKNIMYYPPSGKNPFPMRGAFVINPDNGVITTNLPSYQDFAHGYFQLEVEAFDAKNRTLKDSVIVTVVVHQRGQILRVVLSRPPQQGQQVATNLLNALNEEGKKDGKQFFFIKVSEHRTGSNIVATQTDVCFVVVENKRAHDTSEGLGVLDSARYRQVIDNFGFVDRGTCYAKRSTEDKVKWRDLWWVLVVIAVFIFVCSIILLVTLVILYDRYKNYMNTQRTYLVPQ